MLGTILLASSCNHSFYRKLDNSCRLFIDSIPQIWQPKEGYYSFKVDADQAIAKFIVNVNGCLSGIRADELVSIFGEPNIKDEALYTYFMAEVCLIRKRDCVIQEFIINNDTLLSTSIPRPARGVY